MFTAETLKTWQSWYDIDFSAVRGMMETQTFWLKPQRAKNWVTIGDPVLLADLDFKTMRQTMIDNTATATASVSGELNGLLVYFELGLGPGTVLSTHPAKADETNHWRSPVWMFTNTLTLKAGDCFSVTYRHRVPGSRDRVQVTRI